MTQLVAWAGFLIVARVLTPNEFGIVAAAATISGFVNLVAEFGLGSAIVASSSPTDRQAAQLTGFAVLCGGIAWATTTALALVLPSLLRVPELRSLLPVVGFSTLLLTISTVPLALLRKRLEFRRLSLFEIGWSATQAVALPGLALLGLGYWSFVLSEIAADLVMLLLLWRANLVGIAVPVFSELSEFLRFTRDLLITRVAWYLYSNADFAVVSRRLGTAVLGNYSLAWTLVTAPNERAATLIYSVTPSVFAKVQSDTAAFRRYVLLLLEGLSLLLFPVSAGIALVASDLVPLLLGSQWSGSIPIVQTLAGLGAIRTISPLTSQIFIARGRAVVAMRYTLASAIVLPLSFWLASAYGPVAVASVWITLFPVLIAFQMRAAFREIELPLSTALQAIGPSVVGAVVMCGTVLITRHWLVASDAQPFLRVVFDVFLGALTYSACVAVLAKRRLLRVYRLLRFRTLDR